MLAKQARFRGQMGMAKQHVSHESSFLPKSSQEKEQLAVEIDDTTDIFSTHFQTKFNSADMRQLTLVAHNHMKLLAMKGFIETYCESFSTR